MSIQSTNSIYNNPKERNREIRRAVNHLLAVKSHAKSNRYKGYIKHFHVKPAFCTKCNKSMRPDYAKKQLENKMENAPICIACILGCERKSK